MPTPTTNPNLSLDVARQSLRRLGFYGLLAHVESLLHEPWLARVIDIEDNERSRRSLKRRLDNARLGAFKAFADFDWTWPEKCDRALVDELFSFAFVEEAANVVLVGPNGLGKTMLLKNLTHQAVLRGFSARFTLASDMLHDLAAPDSTTALALRLRRYTRPTVLAIDEVGYLSYDARYADLLFEVVTRRYEQQRPVLLTTNKPFHEWNQVFPNAACVVTLVDRLLHRAEIVALDGKSYRLKEAQERTARKSKSRTAATRKERWSPCSNPTTCRWSASHSTCRPRRPPN
jgi:DNA replication protein DnaC